MKLSLSFHLPDGFSGIKTIVQLIYVRKCFINKKQKNIVYTLDTLESFLNSHKTHIEISKNNIT